MIGRGLSEITEQDLVALAAAMGRGDLRAPLSDAALQARGFGHLADAMSPFFDLDDAGLRAILEVATAERAHRRAPRLTLVWTGDEPGVSHARHTKVFLPELFVGAREHVLIAGYAIDSGAELFGALHQTMVEHGVTAHLFVDVDQLARRLEQHARTSGLSWAALAAPLAAVHDNEARGKAVVALFLRLMWPFGEPRPRVFFDPRTADRRSAMSMHAKCVVIDHAYTLITSANFTSRGQSRNVEAGVAIEDRAFAASLERQVVEPRGRRRRGGGMKWA